MDAKSVEKQIESKLEVIGNTIASFLSIDEKMILNRLKKLNLYVYEDYYHQAGRMRNVDLYNIAYQYSIDIFDGVYLDEETIEALKNKVARIILASPYLDDRAIEGKIKDFAYDKIFTQDNELIIINFKNTIANFLKDYETKDLLSKIKYGEEMHNDVQKRIALIKSEIIKEMFNLELNLTFTVDYLWDALLGFSIEDNELETLSEEFKNKMMESQKRAYRALGISGNTLAELKDNAKKKGLIITKKVVEELDGRLNYAVNNRCRGDLQQYTNIFEIFDKLKDKGFVIDNSNILYLYMNPSNYGANFQVTGKSGLDSYIVFNNNEAMYTNEFNDTCTHEIIHYLGGMNSKEEKRGLFYFNNKIYLDLEESYVNALSKSVKDIVVGKVGNIVEPSKNETSKNYYDCTLEYMKFVFKHYLKELSEIHFSNYMSLKDANKLMPFDQVAKSASRIMNCSAKDVDKYTKEEIEKLKKYIRKK